MNPFLWWLDDNPTRPMLNDQNRTDNHDTDVDNYNTRGNDIDCVADDDGGGGGDDDDGDNHRDDHDGAAAADDYHHRDSANDESMLIPLKN